MAKAAAVLQIGDLVVLKSGGPDMTVASNPDSSNHVYCTWFSGKKNEKAYFAVAALNPAPKKEESKP